MLVGWMFFGPSLGSRPPEPRKNIYQQLIEPNEKKLVWYNFRDKLPEVSPLEPRYHWYAIGEVVASVAVTERMVDVPLKIETLCGWTVMDGVWQTATVMVMLSFVPHVPVTRTQ